jgi:prepilin-type N-terminal cleavage/methylation domain-containing protein
MRRQGGFTLVELMIALLVSSLASAFVFAIYARSSVAYRTQSRVAEVQQTLRAANDVIVKDLRQAGFLSFSRIATAPGIASPATFRNNVNGQAAWGSDQVGVAYADVNKSVRIKKDNNPFVAAVTEVDPIGGDPFGGFRAGDIIFAVRTQDPLRGEGCVLAVTGLIASAQPKIQHNPGEGQPWNQAGNTQCDNIQSTWDDGGTMFTEFVARAYRIRPGDPRGVLELSPSGGFVAGDWQPLAMGFVDLQVAVHLFDDDGLDQDNDGDGNLDWYSGINMDTLPNNQVKEVRLSLVARTTTEVDGVTTPATPDLVDPRDADNNSIGDHLGTDLTNTKITRDATSVYYGRHLYRWTTTTVDMRNLAVGR